MTAGIARNGKQLHHVNPLFGYPGGAPTHFPMGGLPAWIHSGSWNLKLLSPEAHAAAHRIMQIEETIGGAAVNPVMTAGRVSANEARCP